MALNINTKIVNNLTGVVADASSIKGGYLSVDYYEDLANLPADVVEEGSMAYVKNTSNNLNEVEGWEEFQSIEDYIGYYIFLDNYGMIVKVTENNLSWLRDTSSIVLGETSCAEPTEGDSLLINEAGFYRYTAAGDWYLDLEDLEFQEHIYLGEYELDFEQTYSIPVDRDFIYVFGENWTKLRPIDIDIFRSSGDEDEYEYITYSNTDSNTQIFDIGGDPMVFVVDLGDLDNGWFTFSFKPLNTGGGNGIYTVEYYHELDSLPMHEDGTIVHVLRGEPEEEVEGWEDFVSEEDYIGYAIFMWREGPLLTVTSDNLAYLQEDGIITLGQTPCYNEAHFYDAGFYIFDHDNWILLNANDLYPFAFEVIFIDQPSSMIIPGFDRDFNQVSILSGDNVKVMNRPIWFTLVESNTPGSNFTAVMIEDAYWGHKSFICPVHTYQLGENYYTVTCQPIINDDGVQSLQFNVQPLGAGGSISEETIDLMFGYPIDIEMTGGYCDGDDFLYREEVAVIDMFPDQNKLFSNFNCDGVDPNDYSLQVTEESAHLKIYNAEGPITITVACQEPVETTVSANGNDGDGPGKITDNIYIKVNRIEGSRYEITPPANTSDYDFYADGSHVYDKLGNIVYYDHLYSTSFAVYYWNDAGAEGAFLVAHKSGGSSDTLQPQEGGFENAELYVCDEDVRLELWGIYPKE